METSRSSMATWRPRCAAHSCGQQRPKRGISGAVLGELDDEGGRHEDRKRHGKVHRSREEEDHEALRR